MAKTAKLKTNHKFKSIHSRTARREASPSLDLDKSLTSLPRSEAAPNLHTSHTNAGVSKKKKKSKIITRAQRVRQQKSIERAETVVNQLERKVARSIGKSKEVRTRKVAWDDLNRNQREVREQRQAATGNANEALIVEHDQPMLLLPSKRDNVSEESPNSVTIDARPEADGLFQYDDDYRIT